jgi:hypothetical protein
MTARGTLAALLLPLALLSACGDDSDSAAADPGSSDSSTATATETSSPTEPTAEATDTPSATPDWPACGDIWVADAKLPFRYKGCLEGDQAVEADNLSCSSGQRIVRFEDRFFAVAGGKIYEVPGPLDKDKQYLDMVRTCRA